MINADHAVTYNTGNYSGTYTDAVDIIINNNAIITLTGATTFQADSDANGTGAFIMNAGSSIVGQGYNLTIYASGASTLVSITGVGNLTLRASKTGSNPTYTANSVLSINNTVTITSCTLSMNSYDLIVSSIVNNGTLRGANYYVDATGGNDSNPGTYQGKAWKTIAKVNAAPLKPGDSVLFKCGGTWQGQLTIPSSGSAGSPITFKAYGVGANPILDGVNKQSNVITNNQDYIVIDGFEIKNGLFGIWSESSYSTYSNNIIHDNYHEGIRITGTNKSNITVDGGSIYNQTTGNSTGILLGAAVPYITIKNTEFYNQNVAIDGWEGGGSTHLTIDNIYAHDHTGYALHLIDAAGGVFTDIIIQYCNFDHNGIGAIQSTGDYYYRSGNVLLWRGDNGIIRYNKFTRGMGWGMDAYNCDGLTVYNNIFANNYDTQTNPIGPGIGLESNSSQGVTVYNNTFYGNTEGLELSNDEADLANITYKNNIFYANTYDVTSYGNPQTTVVQSNNLLSATNPLFVNAANNDFHLQASSPAIGAGANLSAIFTIDYAGTTRTTPYDIGAYEYYSSILTTLTITGLSANNKVYDGTTAAIVNFGSAALAGILGSDNVYLNVSLATATFTTKNVGNTKIITISGLTLSGADAVRYTLIQPTITANITARPLTMNATGTDKVYDGSLSATVSLLDNRIAGDVLSASYVAAFSDKNVGNAKLVTVSGINISGADAANYTFNTTAQTTANITARPLTVTAATNSKVYDGLTTSLGIPTISSGSLASGDSAIWSESFDNKNVGNGNKTLTPTGTVNDGNSGHNYTVTFVNKTNGTITPATLTIAGISADNKVYDGTTSAVVDFGNTSLAGILDNDVVTLNASLATASFANKNVGTAKAVSVSGISISGTDSANYTFNTTAQTSANITARPLTVSATGTNKVYDGSLIDAVVLSDDRIAGDIFADSYTSANFNDKNVANDKTISVSGINISGTDAANYTFNTTAQTTANVTPRALTISATGTDKVYDGDLTATITLTDNRIPGDTLTTSYVAATFSDENVGNAKPVSVTGISISGPDAANYTFNTTAQTTANITAELSTFSSGGLSTFTGTGNWTNASLWSTSIVPGVNDTVIVDGICTLMADVLGLNSVTINFGKSLNLAGYNISTTNGITNNGTLYLSGNEAISGALINNALSTVEYRGTSSYSGLAAGNNYYHLSFNGPGTWALASNLNISGNLNIATGNTLTANGKAITIAGNWTNNGTFKAGTSTVTLNGTGLQQVKTGGASSAFNTLTITNASTSGVTFIDALNTGTLNATGGVKKLSFATGTGIVHTITKKFNVAGTSSNLLQLAPATAGKTWYLNAPSCTVKYVSVSYCSQASRKTITARYSTNGGHNTNWKISRYG